MRSFILPLAILATSVLAAPAPDVEYLTKGNTVIEYYDVTVTDIVYVTEGSVPAPTSAPVTTTKRRKHKHKTTTPAYVAPAAPQPTEIVVTVTYGNEQPQAPVETPAPEPSPQPAPAPVANSPAAAPQEKPSDTGHLPTDIINIHNYYRAKYDVPLLTWDDSLASYAVDGTGDCVMHHTGGPNGENLAFGYSSATAGVEGWYGEYNQYNYGNPDFSSATGHFTQVIWKGTERVGCYLRDCNGSGYLMCEYQPAGNVIGYFAENVPSLASGYSAE